MSKTLINTNLFEKEIEVWENCYSNIKDIFASEKNNLQFMNNGSVWVGKTQEKLYEKQTMFQNNFIPIEEALEVFINFMKKALDDYNRFELEQLKNQEYNASNLNVNS